MLLERVENLTVRFTPQHEFWLQRDICYMRARTTPAFVQTRLNNTPRVIAHRVWLQYAEVIS